MKSQFVRFLLGGGINTAVTYVLFLVLSSFVHHAVAYSIVYLIGIGLSYAINVRWVFRSHSSARTVVAYPMIYGVQYVYGLAVLSLLIDRLALSSDIAMLIVIGTSVPLTFVLSRALLKARGNVPSRWLSEKNVSKPLEASCDAMKGRTTSESHALLSRGHDARQ
jgi:putative flippase GtrA